MSSSPQIITENLTRELTDQGPAGTLLGAAAADLVGMYGATPIAQRTSASQAAVTTTASTTTSPAGYSTTTQANAIVTLVNELRAAMVAIGMIKGS